MFDHKRNEIMFKDADYFTSFKTLFDLTSDNEEKYRKIKKAFESIVLRETEQLVVKLFENYGYKARLDNPGYDIEFDYNGKHFLLDFKTLPSTINFKENLMKQKNGFYYFYVFLNKDSIDCRKEIQHLKNKYCGEQSNTKLILFESFLETMFGKNEKELFHEAMIDFETDFKKLIGYQITEICTPYNLNKLKKELDGEIKSFDYQKIREKHEKRMSKTCNYPKNIYDNVFNDLLREYIDSNKYKLMLSDADYAKSYLTSEWLIRKIKYLDELDNTCIVAGFLKSIEQLLWSLIPSEQRKKIINDLKTRNNRDNVEATLSNIEAFILKDENLFKTDFLKIYLLEKIKIWRQDYRNKLFHKQTLGSEQKIKEIREDSLYLYFLIIGSLKKYRFY